MRWKDGNGEERRGEVRWRGRERMGKEEGGDGRGEERGRREEAERI